MSNELTSNINTSLKAEEVPLVTFFEQFYKDKETLFLVCFSGGKDSVAMVLHLLDAGISPHQIELHHHDVDGGESKIWDWPCTLSYCQAFARAFDLKLCVSYRQGGISREIRREKEGLQPVVVKDESGWHTFLSKHGYSTRRKFPAVSMNLRTRFCSAVVKKDVHSRLITNLPQYQCRNLIVCTGERWEESPARAHYSKVQYHTTHTKRRNALHYRPIVEWTQRQVWQKIANYHVQPHPAYELGWSRCSCIICVFSSPNTWASIAQLVPALIEYIEHMEQELGFTLYNGKNIRQVAANGKSFLQKQSVRRWKEEALAEFVSAIRTAHWSLPQGAFSNERTGAE